jgi:hypothetical protein
MKPILSKRPGSWVRLGVLGLAALHCGTPSAPDPIAEVPGPPSDPGIPAESSLPDPAALAPEGAPSGDTSLPEVGGQTGDDSGQIGLECDIVTESSLALDDTSRFGFSANQRLALVLGAHEMPLRWTEPVYDASGTLLDYASRGTSSVRVQVELSSDHARLLERWDSTYDMDCGPRLLVDARLTLSSTDGALADTADAVLELGSDFDLVSLSTTLPVAALRGSYAFEPPELGGQAPSALVVSAAFTRYGQSGTVTQQYGQGANGTALASAQWPDWQTCSSGGWVPANYTEPRPAISDLLDDVRRLSPVAILAQDGTSSPAQLDLEVLPNSACHRPPAVGDEFLSGQTQLTLTSDVLPAPVRVPLDFISYTAERHAFFSAASTPCGTTSYYSPQDFVTHCGDWGVDLSGVQSVFLDVESSLTPYRGYLLFHVRGIRWPSCTPSAQGFACAEDAPMLESERVDLGDVRVVLGTP